MDAKELTTKTINKWIKDDAATDSAAIAFYFFLSVPALLLFSVSIGNILLKSEDVQQFIIDSMQSILDGKTAEILTTLLEHTPSTNLLSISAIIGLILLIWTAGAAFRQIHKFTSKVWYIQPKKIGALHEFVILTAKSSLVVAFFGVLLIISIFIGGIVYIVSKLFGELIPQSLFIVGYATTITSFIIATIFCFVVYRILSDSKIPTSDTFIGALVTVSLIALGNYFTGLYLSYSDLTSVYGAIGSTIGLFLLIFYISIMITIGIEFTKVYSDSRQKQNEDKF